jgi:hypothetical protein
MNLKDLISALARIAVLVFFSAQVQAWTLDECVSKTSSLNQQEKSRSISGGFSNLPNAFLWGCSTDGPAPSLVYMMRLMITDKNELEFTKAKMRFNRANLERAFLADPPKELVQEFCPLYKEGKIGSSSQLVYRLLNFDPKTSKDEELIVFRAESSAICK